MKKEKTFEKSFLNELAKASDNEYATLAEEETLSQTTDFIDTGCLALNGLITGDITKGIPNNKIIALAGEEACGKTYMCLQIMREAIKKGYIIVYFDTENAVEKDTFRNGGIDAKKVLYVPVDTVEDFRDQALRIVTKFNETEDDKKPKLLFILDSLGNLSTRKEIRDAEEGNDKKDMTRAPLVKSIFRVLSKKLAVAKIPMLITNHVYVEQTGYVPEKVMSGGSGLKYAASIIVLLSKSKAKDEDKSVSGLILTGFTMKNRFCKPYSKVKMLLDFETGLHKYYGLQGEKKSDKAQCLTNFCEPMLTKDSITGDTWTLNGKKITTNDLFGSNALWTDEMLDLAKKNLMDEFAFGSNKVVSEEDVVLDEAQ